MIYIIVKIIFKLLEIYRKQVKMISNDFIDFVRQSPTAYNCVENVKNVLIANGFNELSETEEYHLEKGKKYFVTRNDSALIAFTLGSKVNENSSFQIVASHCDSPSFKLKPESIHAGNGYVSLNVEPYGGMIMSSFLDRPLSLGGRVIVEKDGKICSQAVYINRPLCLIPSLCIHFNRDVNNGYKFNPQKDLQPLFSLGDKVDFKEFLKDELKIDGEILNYDLFLYNYERGAIFGKENEFFACPRIDNLSSVFTSLNGLINSHNDEKINVMAIFDNEEVGSSSLQGAVGDFLKVTLMRLAASLGLDEKKLLKMIASSFMISADNGHAKHPNYPEITDVDNYALLNKGILIKYNASLSYVTDGLSSSLLMSLMKKHNLPYQSFTNRSDIRGGSTLGNLSLRQLSLLSVDIGLPQLAMHSLYETAGTKDLEEMTKLMKVFYNSKINVVNGVWSIGE